MRLAAIIVATGASLCAQNAPEPGVQKKLAAEYLMADDARAAEIETTLRQVPPLTKSDAKTWVEWAKRAITAGAPKIELKGTHFFYDKEPKRGKYVISGADNTKGLVFGLHGGGVGSADCGPPASDFHAAIDKAGMIGIFPQAVEATEAAWGDDVTIKFMLDLLLAARRTLKFDPNHVHIMGHSMGGYGAWTWGGRFWLFTLSCG